MIRGGPGKITGIAQHRIDDQRLGMVVAAELEAYQVPGHGEPPFDARLPVSIHLIEHRSLETGRAVRRPQR